MWEGGDFYNLNISYGLYCLRIKTITNNEMTVNWVGASTWKRE
jgi:hypothetical protein